MALKCSKCQTKNRKNSKFCSKCGIELVHPEKNKQSIFFYVSIFLVILLLLVSFGLGFTLYKKSAESSANYAKWKDYEKRFSHVNSELIKKTEESQLNYNNWQESKKKTTEYYNRWQYTKQEAEEYYYDLAGCETELAFCGIENTPSKKSCDYSHYVRKSDYQKLLKSYKDELEISNHQKYQNIFSSGLACLSVLNGNSLGLSGCLDLIEEFN